MAKRMSLIAWRYGVTELFTDEGCICVDCQEEDGCEGCEECAKAKEALEPEHG